MTTSWINQLAIPKLATFTWRWKKWMAKEVLWHLRVKSVISPTHMIVVPMLEPKMFRQFGEIFNSWIVWIVKRHLWGSIFGVSGVVRLAFAILDFFFPCKMKIFVKNFKTENYFAKIWKRESSKRDAFEVRTAFAVGGNCNSWLSLLISLFVGVHFVKEVMKGMCMVYSVKTLFRGIYAPLKLQ